MPIARQGASVLSKLISGGGQNYGVPGGWTQSMYGPGWPIAPLNAPQDDPLPRSIDYPISINSTLTPRTNFGLMPFASLLAAYENVAEVSAPVSLIQRELTGFVPHLVDADGQPVDEHPYLWMTKSPDHKTPFGVWLTRFLKSTKIYDAASIYLERSGSKTVGMHYIDGSTLFVLLDQFGNIPDAEPIRSYVGRIAAEAQGTDRMTPVLQFAANYDTRLTTGKPVPTEVPAFTQIIKGTPFAWWSQNDIWYMPQSRRVNAPYGESFIELAWSWIMLIVNVTAFELGHYKTGNMPEGFVTLPKEGFSTADQIMLAELMYNQRMAGNPATERNRLRFFPDGSKYFATKKPDFPKDLYSQAWHNILNAIGLLPSEFGEMGGGKLGGGGQKSAESDDTARHSINPNRDFVSSAFNNALERDGVDDVTFVLDYALEEIDPDKQKTSVYEGMAHGTLSLNDALGQLNQTPIGDPKDKNNIANKHLIVAGASIFVIEDMQTQNGMAVPTLGMGAQASAAPVGPETAAEQAGAEHTPQDTATIQRVIDNLRANGTLDGKTTSLPPKPKTVPPPIKKALALPSAVDMLDELQAWCDKVVRWGALRKFTAHSIPLHVADYVRSELDALGDGASRPLRKALFADAATILGKGTIPLNKDYDSIAAAFQDEVRGLLTDAGDDDPISGQAFGSRFNSASRRAGLQMFRQGMEDQGVSPESLSADQLKVFRDWQADTSSHVSNLRQEAYGEDGISTAQADQRPDYWTNVSLRQIYYKGAASVAPDSLKVWTLGDTEHCNTCLDRAGQVKTLSEWGDAGFPGDFDALDCHGVRCGCGLEDAPEASDETEAEKFDASQLRHPASGQWVKDGDSGLHVREHQRLAEAMGDTAQQHIDAHVAAQPPVEKDNDELSPTT